MGGVELVGLHQLHGFLQGERTVAACGSVGEKRRGLIRTQACRELQPIGLRRAIFAAGRRRWRDLPAAQAPERLRKAGTRLTLLEVLPQRLLLGAAGGQCLR